jgi:hypothetical protein
MQMKKIILVFFLSIYWHSSYSQWVGLKSGFSSAGYTFFYDSTSNLLYVGGLFNYADSIRVNGIATWDGSLWDSLGSGITYGGPVYTITKFQGKIFVSGWFNFTPPNLFNWLSFWNGNTWDTLGVSVNSFIKTFKEHNNELYIGGTFNKIGLQDAILIAKFNGNNFTSYQFPCIDYSVNAIEFYQGYMYVGGNFYDTLSGVNDLERWDGTSFQPFGGNGLAFGSGAVSSMVIYNNELYIAGGFSIATGSPADNIMRWDGSQFHDVGSGLNGGVRQMRVINNEIYVCGDFTMAGSTPVNYVAKWDGNSWSKVFNNTFNNIVLDIIGVGNDLYVTGGFTMIDSMPFNYIAKYANYTSISEIESPFSVNVSPNPASDKIFVDSKSKIIDAYKIFDALGREIKSNAVKSLKVEINIPQLQSGIYFLLLSNEDERIVKKFIKE